MSVLLTEGSGHGEVLRIHEILVRIRMRGSIPLTNGSGSGPADPDPALFVSNLKEVNKNIFFCLLLFEGTFTIIFQR
jgi:hypothetical protein